jgi:transcription initiation factor TFIIF subunit beta
MIVNEAVANPVEDDTALDFFKQSYTAALNAGNKALFSETVRGINWNPTAAAPSFAFGSMTSKPGKGNKKVVKDKAVRLEKPQLLDAIQQCFREYSYWSLKALRNRLHQPEAYIKETLDEIATLVKSGDFVQNYKLKPDYLKLHQMQESMVKDEMAPVKSETDEATGDDMADDDDDMGFEDVEMKSGS